MIYVLYGQSGSGKTTISQRLCEHIQSQSIGCSPVIIDGDKFRELFNKTDYSKKGRESNIRAANTVATYLSKVNRVDVVLALVNPYEHLRAELRDHNSEVIEILLETERDLRREFHVEEFERGNPNHIINTDSLPDNAWRKLKELLNL